MYHISRNRDVIAAAISDDIGQSARRRRLHHNRVITFTAVNLDEVFSARKLDVQPKPPDAILGADNGVSGFGAHDRQSVDPAATDHFDQPMRLIGAGGFGEARNPHRGQGKAVIARPAFQPQGRRIGIDQRRVIARTAPQQQGIACAIAQIAARGLDRLDRVNHRAKEAAAYLGLAAVKLADEEDIRAIAAVKDRNRTGVIRDEQIRTRKPRHQKTRVHAVVIADPLDRAVAPCGVA